jgi:uncharacterized membrane protein (DUF373 family)
MVEVGIVSALREVILTGVLHIDWPRLLVVSGFLLTLALVLRYSGIRAAIARRHERHIEPAALTGSR